jgi:hypothetical protein
VHLEANCRTIEQMRLVNALCRAAEIADEQTRHYAPDAMVV